MNSTKASLESQFANEPCNIEDTEEMFVFRESDDYQSKVSLGNALASQYRFRDAGDVYIEASHIRSDDPMLYIRLGGVYLTLWNFDEAIKAYNCSLELGIPYKSVAYPLGIWHYFQGDYIAAAEQFAKCLPCDDEMKIAVIYWHTICCLRANADALLLTEYHTDMEVGHHTAYQKAVSIFAGELNIAEVFEEMENEKDELNYVITTYGLFRYLLSIGKTDDGNKLMEKLLTHSEIWACISYLAALRDCD